MENLDSEVGADVRTGIKGNIHAVNFGVGVELIIEVATDVFGEFGLVKVVCKGTECFWLVSGCGMRNMRNRIMFRNYDKPGYFASFTSPREVIPGSSSSSASSTSSWSSGAGGGGSGGPPEGKHEPSSICRAIKSMRAAASLSRRWLVRSIWPRGWLRLERRQGSFTALMCFDSVIDEHKPFGAPNC